MAWCARIGLPLARCFARASRSPSSPEAVVHLARHPMSHRVLALLLLAVPLLLTSGCAPRPTVAALDHKVFATPLTEFDRWWRGEQAAANHVPRATVDRWWRSDRQRLDSAA